MHQGGVARLDDDADQYAIGVLPQLITGDLTDFHLAVGHRVTRLDRTQPGRAEHEAQPFTSLLWLPLLAGETRLHARIRLARCHLQVGAADQRIQIRRTHDAELRPNDPELGAGAGDARLRCGDARTQHDTLQIIAQRDSVHLAHGQPLVANGRTGTQSIAARQADLDRRPALDCTVSILVQDEARHLLRPGSLRIGRLEGDTAGEQALQRLAAHLDSGQTAAQRDAAGIPEPARAVHQVGVRLFDMHAHHHLLLVARELVALYRPHTDLPVEHGTADVQRPQTVSREHQMQPRGANVQRRRLGAGDELALGRATFLAGPSGDEVAFHQRFEAGDAAQRDGRLDHPEIGVLDQVVLEQRVDRKLGARTLEVRVDIQLFQQTNLHAVVHHRRASGLQPIEILQRDHCLDPRLGCVEILVETERDVRVGGRAVLAVRGRGEGDAPGDDTGQGLGTELHAGQPCVDSDAAGVPETGVLAHQVRILRLDIELHLHRAVILGEHIVLHLPHLDLPVEHRAATIQRAEALGLECQVQADATVGHRRFLRQRDETLGRLAIGWAHTDVVARHQCLQPGDPGQCDAGLDQPEARAASQIAVDILVHFDIGDHDLPTVVIFQPQVAYDTDRHALVEHGRLVDFNAFGAVEHHLYMDAAFAIRLPGQPGADGQRDQRQNPDGRPAGGRTCIGLWQVSHACSRLPCYPRSDVGRM